MERNPSLRLADRVEVNEPSFQKGHILSAFSVVSVVRNEDLEVKTRKNYESSVSSLKCHFQA